MTNPERPEPKRKTGERVRGNAVRDATSRSRETPGGKPKKASRGHGKQPATPHRASTALALPITHRLMLFGLEIFALCTAGLVGIIALLGESAERFSGVGFWSSLLPFSTSLLGFVLTLALLLKLWLPLRTRIGKRVAYLPAALSLGLAFGAGGFALRDEFSHELDNLRTLVGGVAEAGRMSLAHQVYAAYRRSNLADTRRLLERSRPYWADIEAAARALGMDADLLAGVAAAESSFLPRDSKDGGKGLFQITAPPKEALEESKRLLDLRELNPDHPRHNAFLAAATLRHYLEEMKGDLFLGLLAYNIGPQNGGLLSIMRQYGARDFVTIQPYLQNLPRDYPVRVLSAALAHRIWRLDGALPRYEENQNALRIQKLGIPGLRDAPERKGQGMDFARR
jgi:hypothetical protein